MQLEILTLFCKLFTTLNDSYTTDKTDKEFVATRCNRRISL